MKDADSPARFDDVNAVMAGYLRDLAFAQPTPQQMYGYKRAARAIFALERSVAEMVREAGGTLPKIAGIGPFGPKTVTHVSGMDPKVLAEGEGFVELQVAYFQ